MSLLTAHSFFSSPHFVLLSLPFYASSYALQICFSFVDACLLVFQRITPLYVSSIFGGMCTVFSYSRALFAATLFSSQNHVMRWYNFNDDFDGIYELISYKYYRNAEYWRNNEYTKLWKAWTLRFLCEDLM